MKISEILNEIDYGCGLGFLKITKKSKRDMERKLNDDYDTGLIVDVFRIYKIPDLCNQIYLAVLNGKAYAAITVNDNFTPTHIIGIQDLGKPGLTSRMLLVLLQNTTFMIDSSEWFSPDGFSALIGNLRRLRKLGKTVVDQNGKEIDFLALKQEWENARKTDIGGPTAIYLK